MTDQDVNNDRPGEDPAEGKPDLQPAGAGTPKTPGQTGAPASTGAEGAQGAGGPGGFGTGD